MNTQQTNLKTLPYYLTLTQNTVNTKVILIDDDEIFGRIMKKEAQKRKIELTFCKDLKDLSKISDINNFDVILIDYHLGFLSGSTVSKFINAFFIDIPIMILSASSMWWHKTNINYPNNVKRFIHKDRSYNSIFNMVEEIARSHVINENGLNGENNNGESYEEYSESSAIKWSMIRNAYKVTMAALGNGILDIAGKFLQHK